MSDRDKKRSVQLPAAPRGRRAGMGGMGGMGAPAEKPKDFKGTLKKLVDYLSQYRLALLFVLIFAVGSTVFSIVGPKILGNITTEIVTGLMSKYSGGSGVDFAAISKTSLLLFGLYALSAIFSYIQGIIMTNISQKTTYRLRKSMAEKIDRIPMNFFDKKTHGEILSRFTNDVDTLSQSMNQSLTQIVTSACSLIGIFIMMISISWQMTILAVAILPLSLFLTIPVIKKSQKHFVRQQATLGTVNGQVEEVFGGLQVIKAFHCETDVQRDFDEENDKLYNSSWKAQFLSGLMMPIMSFVGNIGYVAVAVLGGYFASQGVISVGDIQSFIQYTRSFTQPITQLAQVSNMLQSTVAAAERIFEFLEEPEEPITAVSGVGTAQIEGVITFDHVQFGYDPEKTVIRDFTSTAPKGKKIAIVGPTGAGKTTMVKLLMRFYDVNAGRILVDGQDIRDFERGDLRRQFGMVLQDTWLFHGTVMENIRYGRLDATDDEVIAAAKAAHVHHFIQTLPDGYSMVLNEEAENVSQGQKQLLTIARTILADPKMLILDEATSSVDTRTELRIQKAMDHLMQGRTSFVIAHRLSTIKDADTILVMRDGDIVEQGDHETLLAENGFYAELYLSQFQEVG